MVAYTFILSYVGIAYCQIADNNCKNNCFNYPSFCHSSEKMGKNSWVFFLGKAVTKEDLQT